VADGLLTFFFFMLGIAIVASGYRVVIAVLPNPVYAIPHRAAAHLIILFWALAALGFVAWYLSDLELAPRP
jgi:hypothetical protein